jgi:ADP-ribosylglycohydrolase
VLDEGEDLQEVMAHFAPGRSPGHLEARKTAEQNSESTSSSCLIRAAPLAIWGHRLTDKELEDAIRKELTLTHTNDLAIQACTCYALFIKYLIITNGDRNDSLEFVYQYATLNEYSKVLELLDRSHKSKGIKVTDCTSDPESYEHGFVWGIHLVSHEYNFTDALRTWYE